jgi:hypothetical protein
MKKFLFVAVLVVLAASFAMAQQTGGTVIGNTSYVPTVDNMGAHENGGRGCAGCHAPHSGGRGSGGNTLGANLSTAGMEEGGGGLWGTDLNPIINAYGGTINFTSASYSVTLTGATFATTLGKDVATCLSCHDGNASTGAMMTGTSYEQNFGLLNFSSVSNLTSTYNATTGNWTRTTGLTGPALYGNAPIPTLLGNDGGIAGDYSNDHPMGMGANMLAVLEGSSWASLGVTWNKSKIQTVAAGSPYAAMVQSYGYPALGSLAANASGAATDGSAGYVVCTTCHNQHVMNVYQSNPTSWGTTLKIGGVTSTGPNTPGASFATIFFVNGPYNPGAPYDPKHLPSTMRFCQECHFTMSPEAYGASGIGTAF